MNLLLRDQITLNMERQRVVRTLRLIEQDISDHGSTWPLQQRRQKMKDELRYIESTHLLVKWALEVERGQMFYQSLNTCSKI